MNTGVWYLETIKHIHETSDRIININYLSLAITCVFFLDTAIWLRKIYYQNENQKEKAILLQSALLNKKIKFYVSDEEETSEEETLSKEQEEKAENESSEEQVHNEENESSEEQVQNEENESSEEDDVSDDNYIEQEEDYIENEDNVFTKEMSDELSNLLNTLENNTSIISEKLSAIYKENNIEEPPQ